MMLSLSSRARLLLKVSFLTTFAESMLVPMYAAFTEMIGGSILDAGIAFGTFSIATGLAVAGLGTRPWFERHLRTFLVLGFFVSSACDFSYLFVENRWQLFGTQVFAGLATGLIEPAWDSLFADNISNSSAKHWSIWAGGTHLASGVAALVGGVIVSHFSFSVLFVAMGIIDTLAMVATLRGDPRPIVND